jgi:hypothetical protein
MHGLSILLTLSPAWAQSCAFICAGAPIPGDLLALAESFGAKRKAGTAQAHGSGYGGSGFKFDTQEDEERRQARKVRALQSSISRPLPLCPCNALSAIGSQYQPTGDGLKEAKASPSTFGPLRALHLFACAM